MQNGPEDYENQEEDEVSTEFSNQTSPVLNDPEDGTVASDNDPSRSEGNTSNENPDTREVAELEEGDNEENNGNQNEPTESMAGFLKLLPYMYLFQRNYAANPSLTPNFELTSSQADSNSAGGGLGSLMESDTFKNLQMLRYLQQFLPNGSNSENGLNGSNEANGVDTDDEMDDSSELEEPLDLTQKNVNLPSKSRDDRSIIQRSQRTDRSYTTEDLELALHDIQSGKLGTRRAAVIYGIPRSTLRNKVYKLGKNPSPMKSVNYNNGHFHKPLESLSIKRPSSDDGSETNGTTRANHSGFMGGKQRRLYSENPCSLLRIDTLAPFRGVIGGEEGYSNGGGESNHLLFMTHGRGYNQRGRQGSGSSLSLPNYPHDQEGSGAGFESFGDSSLAKKSRPKRGKYRNYDREALAKAVAAVQNGEMSVHRAGSYFGVPHSTLEYKVKERHLLRQAKFKGKTTKPVINKMSEQASGLKPVTSLSPSVTADSNDSSNFQKLPDLERSISHFLSMKQQGKLGEGENRWKSPSEIVDGPAQGPGKEINDPLPKIYEANETLANNPADLLDLTRRT